MVLNREVGPKSANSLKFLLLFRDSSSIALIGNGGEFDTSPASLTAPEAANDRLGAAPLWWPILVGGLTARALLERILQRPRPVVLGQQIGEGLIGELL